MCEAVNQTWLKTYLFDTVWHWITLHNGPVTPDSGFLFIEIKHVKILWLIDIYYWNTTNCCHSLEARNCICHWTVKRWLTLVCENIPLSLASVRWRLIYLLTLKTILTRIATWITGQGREIEGLVRIILRARPVRWVSLRPCTVYNAGLICCPNTGSH